MPKTKNTKVHKSNTTIGKLFGKILIPQASSMYHACIIPPENIDPRFLILNSATPKQPTSGDR